MAVLRQNWRIYAALLLAAVMMWGAYFLARGAGATPVAEASTETALLQQIASKDSDGDGLPDWEEALYGTDPHKFDTRGLGMSDGDAVSKGLIVPIATANVPQATSTSSATSVAAADYGLPSPQPGSLTDTFAQNFFTLYLQAKQANNGADLTEQQMSDLAQKAVDQLTAVVGPAPDFKSIKDLTISGTGSDALHAFAVSAEQVLAVNYSPEPEGELAYLQDAVQKNDSSAPSQITNIAKRYRSVATGLAALPVPEEIAPAMLSMINAMARIADICDDFAKIDTDPITTMLALQQYPQAVLDMGNAFISIYGTYSTAGIVFAPGTPGAQFVNVIPNVAASQKTTPTTP